MFRTASSRDHFCRRLFLRSLVPLRPHVILLVGNLSADTIEEVREVAKVPLTLTPGHMVAPHVLHQRTTMEIGHSLGRQSKETTRQVAHPEVVPTEEIEFCIAVHQLNDRDVLIRSGRCFPERRTRMESVVRDVRGYEQHVVIAAMEAVLAGLPVSPTLHVILSNDLLTPHVKLLLCSPWRSVPSSSLSTHHSRRYFGCTTYATLPAPYDLLSSPGLSCSVLVV